LAKGKVAMLETEAAPLAGLRVLDASRVLAGPFCGQTLADLGAEVIKLERPALPDETRTWGPPWHEDLSAYYLSCNRGKKAITLDLGKPEGVALCHELLSRCDVLVENFLPSRATKLGLDAAALHLKFPRLIICSISGYGRTGPWAEKPGYDFALQAQCGLMSITGPVDGPPFKVGVAITDILAGLYAAIGILACVRARSSSGHGYALDVALLDCAVAAQVNVVQAYLTGGQVPPRQGNAHLQIVPYQLFDTADSHLVLAIGNDGQWLRFCHAVHRQDLADDERFKTNPLRVRHRQALIALLQPILKSRTSKEWEQLLSAADVPHSLVLDYDQLFAHPQTQARGLRIQVKDRTGKPVDLLRSPIRIDGAGLPQAMMPPRPGEHTDEILRAYLGLTPERLQELRILGVI
jgi:crotonobetainyl-CoA:carnitine CoA-transferase CaiB-like acyl-CoA transferase